MATRLIIAVLYLAALTSGPVWAQKKKKKFANLEIETAQGPVTVSGLAAARQYFGAEKLAEKYKLPGTVRDQKWDAKVSELDLEDEKKYKFFSKRGGTSIGIKIAQRGVRKKSGKPKRKSGMFTPLNTSAIPEAEITSYRVSRLLEVSHLFNPSTYYTLGPKATRRFRSLMRRREYDQWRRTNTKNLRKKLRRNKNSLFGVYKYRPRRRSQEVTTLVRKNRFKTRHWLARHMRASGKRPSEKLVGLRGVRREKRAYKKPRASKRELARQLSSIFVVDMMTGQWDRFSGTNLEALAHKDGRLQFIARDNGGGESSPDWDWYWKYAKYFSRYDRDLVERLGDLNDFLQGNIPQYKGFSDKEDMRIALGFRTADSFFSFVWKVQHFTQTLLPERIKKYGEKVYFNACVKHCQS